MTEMNKNVQSNTKEVKKINEKVAQVKKNKKRTGAIFPLSRQTIDIH